MIAVLRSTVFAGLAALVPILIDPPIVRADTWSVDIVADENDASCTPGDCSLREALAAAADGDTIAFALPGSPPWTITISAALGQLTVTEDLTITGPGAADLVLSGNNARRVMTIEASTAVALSGLTFRDGRAHQLTDKHGGCLKVLGALTIASSRFESCESWDGGLTSNTEGGDGGAVFVAAGASFDGDRLVFSVNEGGLGGGPSGLPPGFRGGRGGALANRGIAWLRRSTVDSNVAGAGQGPSSPGGFGGGIANLTEGSLRVDDSTFSGNRSGDGGTFMAQTGADGLGGALFCEADCALNNVTISGNAIGSTATGGANIGGGVGVQGGTTRLRNVTVAGNTANGTGGGIGVATGGTIRTRNSIFSGNSGASNQHDCTITGSGSVVSEGHNLIRVNNDCAAVFSGTDQEGTSAAPLDAVLGSLAANGGDTLTLALGSDSPAIDGGDPSGCLAWNGVADVAMPFDQRGLDRELDGDGDTLEVCDAGAFEAAAVSPVEHELTVTLGGGAGGGSVTSDPVGIACPADCAESYIVNETVDLTAIPASGFVFTGWAGDCTGVAACSVTMSADRTVSATFTAQFDLTVNLSGGGSGAVESVPAGIDCPGTCTSPFLDGQTVTLSAAADPGSYFTGWSGSCSGSAGCATKMTEDRTVTATFEDFVPLEVSLAGDGSGSVTSDPPGIGCPGQCEEGFELGEVVTLSATPGAGSTFAGWSGDCAGSSCAVTMSVARSVTATFLSDTLFADGFESGGVCEWSAALGAPSCPP